MGIVKTQPINNSLFHINFIPPDLSGDILLIREYTTSHSLTVLNKLLTHKHDNGCIDILSKSEKVSDFTDSSKIRKEYLHNSDSLSQEILKEIFGSIDKTYNAVIICNSEDPSLGYHNFINFFNIWKLFFHIPQKTFFINKHYWMYSYYDFFRIQKAVSIGDKEYYYNAMLTSNAKQELVNRTKKSATSGEIVEIGRDFGGSAVGFALCLKSFDKKLFSVDTGCHPIQEDFLSLYGVKDHIQIFDGGSIEAYHYWKTQNGQNISLVFIDGDHREDAVALDIKLWSELLIPGGTICLHEYGFNEDCQSTKIIYQEIVSKPELFKNFKNVCDIFIAQKR